MFENIQFEKFFMAFQKSLFALLVKNIIIINIGSNVLDFKASVTKKMSKTSRRKIRNYQRFTTIWKNHYQALLQVCVKVKPMT